MKHDDLPVYLRGIRLSDGKADVHLSTCTFYGLPVAEVQQLFGADYEPNIVAVVNPGRSPVNPPRLVTKAERETLGGLTP